MKHDAATEETREQAALYALGALSQIEARAFDVHIREGCSACETELHGFDGVVGVLGLYPEPASPPIYLRDLLVARIEKETAPAAPAPKVSVAQPRQPDVAASPARPGGFKVILPWAIAASLALATLGSIYAWRRADERASSQDAQIAAFMVERNRLQHRLEDESKTGSENAAMLRALQSPGARMIHMAAQQSIAADGELVWNTGGAQCVVSATLPLAPAGKVYQLWFVTSAAPQSAGLLETDSAGHGFKIVNVPPGLGPVNAAAITLEPEGGSEKPTMPIYAVGKMS
jgi:hypothetical protein